MITLRTGDLLGLCGDVKEFACPDENIPRLHCVQLEWDGTELHATATDEELAGISSWSPDDAPEGDDSKQDGLWPNLGGADDPWTIVLDLPTIEEVLRAFKLPAKQSHIPVNLDYIRNGTDGRLRITRHVDMGAKVGLAVTANGIVVDFPDVRGVLDHAPRPRAVTELEFNGERLGRFGAVRQRGGALKLTFAGDDGLTLVRIGDRFRGAIQPVRARPARLKVVAA